MIYCAGGNPQLSQIALEEGWLLGFRSDKWFGDFPVTFIDVDYHRPNFERHLATVATHKPKYATVPDLSEKEVSQADVNRAIEQAEQLQPHCEVVLIVPKLSAQLAMIPPRFAIGYSIPSSYGGAQYPLWELSGRHVHLLGGSPRKQIQVYLHLAGIASIMSVDGNYAQKMATRYGEYWTGRRWIDHPDAQQGKKDVYLDCWRRSCQNILKGWRAFS